jgi:MFS family permease
LLAWLRAAVGTPVRRLVREPGMRAPHLALLASYVAVLAALFVAPFFLQQVLGTSAGTSGLVLLAYPAATAVTSPIGGALSDRTGPRPIAVAGAILLTAGLALLIPLSPSWSPAAVIWRLALVGAGFGLCTTSALATAMANAGPDRLGLSGATTNIARQAGLALGPALATLAWGLEGYDLNGMRTALAVAAVLSVATIPAALNIRGHRVTDGPAPAPRPRHHSYERSTLPCH